MAAGDPAVRPSGVAGTPGSWTPVLSPALRVTLGPPPAPGRTAVVHAAPPAPEQDAPRGTRVGVVPQGSADVREGLLVVAGLVHAPLRAHSSMSGRPPRRPAPGLPPAHRPRPPCRRAWGSPRRGTSRTRCPPSAALSSGSPRTPLWGQARWVPRAARVSCPPTAPWGRALTVELAHGAGVGLTLQGARAVPRPPGVHKERGGALGDAHAGREVVRRVPVEVATEP